MTVLELAASLVQAVVETVVSEAPFTVVEHLARKAANENAREFETADPNHMAAWKHFPW